MDFFSLNFVQIRWQGMNKTIHCNNNSPEFWNFETNIFSLTFWDRPDRNFSLIGFFMFALVLILSVWIEASRQHAPLAGVHL